MNGHKVNSVADLHNDATTLLNTHVLGSSDVSADGIIRTLVDSINVLKQHWEGADAGVQINDVVTVTNGMIALRNALGSLAVAASEVACNYRDIQRSNGAKQLPELQKLRVNDSTKLQPYTDNRDKVYIDGTALTGKQKIQTANANIVNFISNVTSKKNDILNNWTQGTGRDQADQAFNDFISKYNSTYKPMLETVLEHIDIAIKNYGM